MADLTVQVIRLTPTGEGTTTVDMGDQVVQLVTRYNYRARCWTMDILDIDDVLLVGGLMLVPNVDILIPYTLLKETLGALVLVELKQDDYRSDELLGVQTALLWYPPGTEVVVPT